jgi:hypothetical protein
MKKSWSGFIRVKIEPNITYFGLGEGTSANDFLFDNHLPKFFVHNVKSKDDLKTRVELIIRWVEQQQKLFDYIGKAFEKELPKIRKK